MRNHQYKTPPLEWIRAFEAAARCGSFTAAATETGLTQSAISQRIGHLEKRLGTRLFYRQARSIALTVEGEAWLPHVRVSLDALRDSAEAIFGTGTGQLTLSASQSIIDLWVIPRLGPLLEITGGRLTVQTMVLGANDAALDDIVQVRYGAGDWPHEQKLQLFEEQIVPLASPSLAKKSGHWSQWPRIACSGPRPGWNEWASRFGVTTTPVAHLRFDTFLSALSAARKGAGVILGSLPLCKEDIEQGRLVRLNEEVLHHHESYWAIAGREAAGRKTWESLSTILKQQPSKAGTGHLGSSSEPLNSA